MPGVVGGRCIKMGRLLIPSVQMPRTLVVRCDLPLVSPNVSHPLCTDACGAAWGAGAEGALAAGAAGVGGNSSRSIKLPASDVVRTVSEYPCSICFTVTSARLAAQFPRAQSNVRKL